jgi:DNA replication protein
MGGKFEGFKEDKIRSVPLPESLFTELLPQIDDLNELKVTLYALWFVNQLEGGFRYLRSEDVAADERFLSGLASPDGDQAAALKRALERAVARGTLLCAEVAVDDQPVRLYFLNSERGRAALRAIEKGEWKPTGDTRQPIALDMERPNVFRLYEENIGPLTPLIADVLREAEATYPLEWIQEAVRIAVENNVRRWRYVEAILSSWKKEGRDAKDRRDTEEDRHKYVKGKYADFVEH